MTAGETEESVVLPIKDGIRVLKVLFVAVEGSPYAKVGGLADVVASLPKALTHLGHEVRTVLPRYRMVDAELREVASFKVDVNPWWIKRAKVYQDDSAESPTLFLDTDEWFHEADSSEKVYTLGVDAYLFFARAVLRYCEEVGWIPDVVHVHDWHTGILPAMMRVQHSEFFDGAGCVFTVHNLAYQGEFGPEVLGKVGLPESLFNMHQTEAYGSVNFLKTGCVFADAANTVSRTYAEEIQTSEYGCRLEGLLSNLAQEGRLSGIVNGIDYEEWNPATDLRIAANFDVDHPQGKAECRRDAYIAAGLDPIPGAALATVVSRLSSQKGMDLFGAIAEKMVELPIQLVVQGLGDPGLAEEFRGLEARYPNHIRFIQKFDVDLAQRLYAGADLFLMPSAYEPCGLGQLIAMRYGSIPVVRRTGGLADTVEDGANGFVFDAKTPEAFLEALERAAGAFRNPQQWSQFLRRAMSRDSSWRLSALAYERLYAKSVLARQDDQAIAI